MKTILNFIILGLQSGMTFLLLIAIYMIFVLLDYQGGIEGFLGTMLFQPLLAGLLSGVTIAVCLVVGLPIRIRGTINSWWTKNLWLPITTLLIGICFLILSGHPTMRETVSTTIENQSGQKEIPNLTFVTMGWILTAFSMLHVFPSSDLRLRIERLLTKYTGWDSKSARQHFVYCMAWWVVYQNETL